MGYCPVCDYEYREGITVCPDCGGDLQDQAPDEELPDADLPAEEMVVVYEAKDEMEAKIVKAFLEDSGITVWERSDIVKAVDPLPVGPLAQETLAVPASRVEEAKALIQQVLDSDEAS